MSNDLIILGVIIIIIDNWYPLCITSKMMMDRNLTGRCGSIHWKRSSLYNFFNQLYFTELKQRGNLPLQSNCDDCGVFICQYAKHLLCNSHSAQMQVCQYLL